jgi:hypothetical protein
VGRPQLIAVLVSLPLVFAALLVLAAVRDRVPNVPRSLEEPPEPLHPVELAVLWSAYRKHFSPRTAYRAELLHLARVGTISMDPVGTVSDPVDFVLTLREPPEAGIDEDFVRFLFPSDGSGGDRGSSVLMSRLHPDRTARARLSRWWVDLLEGARRGLESIWSDQRFEVSVAFLVGFFGSWLAAGLAITGSKPVGRWLPFATILVGWAGWILTAWALPAHLPEELRARLAAWRSFRRHLRTFASVRDAPAAGVVIWEDHLVYALALGVAGRVERQLRALDAAPLLPSPWHGAPSGAHGLSWFRQLRRRGPRALPPTPAVAALR